MIFRVAEKFVSINGEGARAGQTAVFIRLAGCNLHCSYCDTMWANESDVPCTEMTEGEIHEYISRTGITNVTLTGGEPLNHPGIEILLKELCSDKRLSPEIETNGSCDISPYDNMPNRPAFTLDYKLPSSGMEKYMLLSNYDHLRPCDVVKLVSGSEEDLQCGLKLIRKYGLDKKCHVYFSPVFGKLDPVSIAQFLVDNRLNGVNMQLQLHKLIWSPDKRGV